jgi:hypothetical protein
MTFIIESKRKTNSVRGFGGSGGKRSIMTVRGGTGRGANRRITRKII